MLFFCRSLKCSSMICTSLSFFFFNDTATTEIYTLSLHDALPISRAHRYLRQDGHVLEASHRDAGHAGGPSARSEEHTSELQSQSNIVCRLLLEKKKNRRMRKLRLYSAPALQPCNVLPQLVHHARS